MNRGYLAIDFWLNNTGPYTTRCIQVLKKLVNFFKYGLEAPNLLLGISCPLQTEPHSFKESIFSIAVTKPGLKT